MKLLIHYLLLVGLPVLGVLGVLRVGQSLRPPVSVSGPWTVEVSRQVMGYSSCEDQLRQSEPLVLSISQSGPHLTLSFNNKKKINLEGEIESTRVNARSLHAATNPGSDKGNSSDAISLYATIDRQAGPERLLGALSFSKCPAAPEINFVATRQVRSKGEVR